MVVRRKVHVLLIARSFHSYTPCFRVTTRGKRQRSKSKQQAKVELDHTRELDNDQATETVVDCSVGPEKDIESINKDFLQRTKGLEPDIELKQLPQIKQEFNQRYKDRYVKPSEDWYVNSWRSLTKPKIPLYKLINSDFQLITKLKAPNPMEFQPVQLMESPLNVGDFVLLKMRPNELAMCVSLPSSTMDPRYTFVTIDGTMCFATKNRVLLRIPHKLPAGIRSLIQPESHHKHLPIGTVKNFSNQTNILPIVARQLITGRYPAQISKLAWKDLPITTKKLQLLHRSLQNYMGPWQIPFFTLVGLVQKLDLNKALDDKNGINYLTSLVNNYHTVNDIPINSPTFVSTYWAIMQQQESNLWGEIHLNTALLSPISVTIIPLKSQHLYYAQVIEKLEANSYREVNKFVKLVNERKYRDISALYPSVIQLLKDFAAGNFHNNGIIVALISKIFRKIERYKDCDITRDICQDLINEITPNSIPNPLLLNMDLALPASSKLVKWQQKLYDLTNIEELQWKKSGTDDDRYDFGDLRVFCIDSETAHEIDDGVSVKNYGRDGLYTLYIHIADPTSMFPESTNVDIEGISTDILNVALKRSFTTYLPDTVVPMLPQSICHLSDLGKQGQRTKTISFSVDVKITSKCSGKSIEIMYDSFKIRKGIVSNFPKATYEDVDRILSSPNGEASPVKKDLEGLSMISKLLREQRIKNSNAVIFGEGFNKGLVMLNADSEGELTEVTFSDQEETLSTILVSEMMILANTLTGRYFAENKIGGVFRCYKQLPLGEVAQQQYDSMITSTKKGIFPKLKDIVKLSSLLNSSFYTGRPFRHEMIGAKQYLTVTSPLRRFPDLINHLQIHRHLQKKPLCFNQTQIDSLIWPIQSRADILKRASRNSSTYWTLNYLKKLTKLEPERTFDVMVTSVPQNGFTGCVFPDLSFARGTLKLHPSSMHYPMIGDIVKNCKISKIDCLEGMLELEKL
ncbi:ALS_1a_G0044220.mRNA.1.CDS.1 [Saccharomyces cerevisiae]|nr:Dss1p [Saccharomyces cerevisiae YJM1450]CAI4712624.1 ALS_1a_G0044220.mRNA.1.CDS.1 [Saccharomyces cerevisiae]CAI6855448.1 ALS_1a_G0044220.mRNA.1.CDS.1 [Saccharomyces cerevisiae]